MMNTGAEPWEEGTEAFVVGVSKWIVGLKTERDASCMAWSRDALATEMEDVDGGGEMLLQDAATTVSEV